MGLHGYDVWVIFCLQRQVCGWGGSWMDEPGFPRYILIQHIRQYHYSTLLYESQDRVRDCFVLINFESDVHLIQHQKRNKINKDARQTTKSITQALLLLLIPFLYGSTIVPSRRCLTPRKLVPTFTQSSYRWVLGKLMFGFQGLLLCCLMADFAA